MEAILCCPLRVLQSCNIHTLAVLSSLAVSTLLLSGDHAQPMSLVVCPSRVSSACPVATSHTLAVLSSLAVSTLLVVAADCACCRGVQELRQGLKSLLNNKEHSDVQFMVEGRTLWAHRAILSLRESSFGELWTALDPGEMSQLVSY